MAREKYRESYSYFNLGLMDYDYKDFFPGVVDIPDGQVMPCFCFHLTWYSFAFRTDFERSNKLLSTKKVSKELQWTLQFLVFLLWGTGDPTSSRKKLIPNHRLSTFGGSVVPGAREPQKRNPPNHWGLSDAFGDRAPRSERRSLQCLPPWLLLGQWRV